MLVAVEDFDDVGMVDLDQALRLFDEAPCERGVIRELPDGELHDDLAISEFRVGSQLHRSHRAVAESALEAVPPVDYLVDEVGVAHASKGTT